MNLVAEVASRKIGSPTRKLLLRMMALFLEEDGEISLSITTLARSSQMSKGTAKRTLRDLEKDGLIRRCGSKPVKHGYIVRWDIDRETLQRLPLCSTSLDDKIIARSRKKKISNALRLRIYDRDGYRCVYCKARQELTLDHVTAESHGGSSEANNLVTCCKTCNSKKGQRSFLKMMGVCE